jgi:hypothetical protein
MVGTTKARNQMNETAQIKGYGLFQRGKGGKWYCIARTEGGNSLAGAERILEAKAWPLYAPSIGKRRLSLYTGLNVQSMAVTMRQKNYAGGHEMAPVFIQTPEEQEAFEAFERMEFARHLVATFPHRDEAYLANTFPNHASELKEVFSCRRG